jgi:hypothetical protein
MIDTPTLFILGAGASKPYGYPTGAELRADIVNNFSADIKNIAGDKINTSLSVELAIEQVDNFVKCFSKSSLKSIDKYLALNPDHSYIGKIAITRSILKHEMLSVFRENVDNANEDWYTYLYNYMTDGFTKPEDYKHFCENKVAFITFNYDRSLEYFLYDSFFHSFNQKEVDMRKYIDGLIPFPIIHVYDTVGALNLSDWFSHSIDYQGRFNNFSSIEARSKDIRVIGEDRAGEEMRKQVKKLLVDYKRIFFLGFSYAQENLDAIDLPNEINENWNIFGTAKGMTEREIYEARRKISSNFPDYARNPPFSNLRLKDVDSCSLLREHL